MKCEKCVEQGLRSTIHIGASTSTLIAVSSYYDEDGNYRLDDPNVTTTGYSCSNGHHWVESNGHHWVESTGGFGQRKRL